MDTLMVYTSLQDILQGGFRDQYWGNKKRLNDIGNL